MNRFTLGLATILALVPCRGWAEDKTAPAEDKAAPAEKTAPAEGKPAPAEEKPAPEDVPYKDGEIYPFRNFRGLDFADPLVPFASAERLDVGRVTLNTVMPYALLASAFAFESTDKGTLAEIGRWRWAGVDESADNYPMLYMLCSMAGASIFLPAKEDEGGYSVNLRLDRFTVYAISEGVANAEVELLKPLFGRTRPNGRGRASRPSGHTATAFAAMAFFSDVLRDTFRPWEEPNLGLRMLEEVATAVPYLGAFYMGLERVHGQKHYLTDTLLGAALGALTEHIFYSWSFLRSEYGLGWFDAASVTWNPDRHGLEVSFTKEF